MRATHNGVDWPNSFTFLLLKPQFHTFFRSISSLQSSISSSLIVNLKISFYIFLYFSIYSISSITFTAVVIHRVEKKTVSPRWFVNRAEAPKPSSSGPSSRSWAPFSGRKWRVENTTRLELIYGIFMVITPTNIGVKSTTLIIIHHHSMFWSVRSVLNA
jgi:hypothetical protein